jgi:hypothetical protein
LTFAGGEELYVFINKQLVVQLFHDPGNNSVPCAIVELQSASGSFSIILSTWLFKTLYDKDELCEAQLRSSWNGIGDICHSQRGFTGS